MFTLEPTLDIPSDSESLLRSHTKEAIVVTETSYLNDDIQETSGPSSDVTIEDNTVCIVGMGKPFEKFLCMFRVLTWLVCT